MDLFLIAIWKVCAAFWSPNRRKWKRRKSASFKKDRKWGNVSWGCLSLKLQTHIHGTYGKLCLSLTMLKLTAYAVYCWEVEYGDTSVQCFTEEIFPLVLTSVLNFGEIYYSLDQNSVKIADGSSRNRRGPGNAAYVLDPHIVMHFHHWRRGEKN